jgi:starch synthase
MKIAMIASEAVPFAKTGGLADVMGTLTTALENLGHQITLIIPAYRCVLRGEFHVRELPLKISVPISDHHEDAAVLQSTIGKSIAVYLIRADRYFDREFLYGVPTKDYPDNAQRFAFFNRAALEILRSDPVDIVHAHDWQAALAIVFLKTQAERYQDTAAAKTLFTIHNLGFQGLFDESHWPYLNLERKYFTPQFLEFYGKINLLKGGLIFADKLTTVSPNYAQEIMTKEQGFGLEGVVRQRAADLVGILNGVDYEQWNPWTDPYLQPHHGENNLTVKRNCKKHMRQMLNLPDSNNTPVVAMISRLTPQKGIDLVESAFDRLMERDLQFVLLGSGDAKYAEFFHAAADRYPDRVAVRIGFDEKLAHRIEAGADIFLMPSLYEPCGLNQMYSLKYGTIPIVRAVGGLKDTVQEYDPQTESGTGFVFESYDPETMLDAIDRCLAAFQDKTAWAELRRRAMSMDYSWDRSAHAYSALYKQLMI